MTLALRVLQSLAAAEAATWGALAQRAHLLPFWTRRKRREVEHEHDLAGALELVVPFALNQPTDALRAAPGPRSEWFVFQLRVLRADGSYDHAAALDAWRALADVGDDTLPPRLSLAQRAALRALRAGVGPPRSGHDHARYADDAATVRALAITAGRGAEAIRGGPSAELDDAVALDASITNAEDGVWVAQAAAALIAALAAGSDVADAVQAALVRLPGDSWAAERARYALDVGSAARTPLDLAFALDAAVANAAYSYGDAAPDALAIALPILRTCFPSPDAALLAALAVPRHATAVAPLVAAACAAAGYPSFLSSPISERLTTLAGVGLPQLRGVRLATPTHDPPPEEV